ncbi:hypothetical protein NNJEOMEG_01805 [Fundidesulfovibrio magnetotacticus]|uniref:Uncharacterized protein n=1 Tax=Fundidesulfovibrio magnetotacticus TaxID=2730080 RepID=A0A6V8LWD2_9BACT|nr:hypothetical protein [Fundidesulfovibrio magnetotacticus]GFK93967.1 hypothetical protein NNJEOMEG_01805 [Fundidesulfovibrio magnetotacticus]
MGNEIREAYEARQYQGASPAVARHIFWGTDANFDSELSGENRKLVLEYLRDGPAFWRQHKGQKHHPFVVDGYKFQKGRRYHVMFQKLGFYAADAEDVCFADLCGYSEDAKFDPSRRVPLDHLVNLARQCFTGGKMNFMPISVLRGFMQRLPHVQPLLALSASDTEGVLALTNYKLKNPQEIPVYLGKDYAVVRHYHFSCSNFSCANALKLRSVSRKILSRDMGESVREGVLRVF